MSSWIRTSSGSASIWGGCCFLWRNRYITFDSEFPSYKPLSQITYQIEFLKLLFFLWMEILNFNKLFWLLFLFLACVAHTYAGLKLSKTFFFVNSWIFSKLSGLLILKCFQIYCWIIKTFFTVILEFTDLFWNVLGCVGHPSQILGCVEHPNT